MAENKPSGAQNILGELFVQFGSKGLPGLLMGLSQVSAKFLVGKKAAEEFSKPIINLSKDATNAAIRWEKFSTVMGMSLKDLQDIEIFTKLNNIDYNGYINQIKNVQQKLIDIRTGMSNDVQGLTLLGLTAYDFDPKKPLEFLEKVKQRVIVLDEVTAAAALRWLGLSEDLLYIWKQQNNNFNDRLKLNDKELNSLKEQQIGWNSLNTTWEAAQRKFIANQTWINKILQKTQDWIRGTHPLLERTAELVGHTAELFNEWLDKKHPYFENLMKSLEYVITHSKEEMKEDTLDFIGHKIKWHFVDLPKETVKYKGNEFDNPQTIYKYLKATKINKEALEKAKNDFLNSLIPQADPNNNLQANNWKSGIPALNITPEAAANVIQNGGNTQIAYNIDVTQHNTGADAQMIANKSVEGIKDVLNPLQYQNQVIV